MKTSSKKRNALTLKILTYAVLIAVLIYTIVPFATVILTSARSAKDAVRGPFTWPEEWSVIENYIEAWKIGNFSKYLLNSFYMIVLTVFGTLIVATLAGYSFAKFRYPGRNVMYYILLIGMMIPFQTIMLPLYFTLKSMGMLNSLTGISLLMIGTGEGFAIMMMRSFFISIPDSMIEAARLDGWSELKVLMNDPESREFYCDVIMDEAGKMNKLVKNLLTLNELEFGNEVVTMERFDLASMIHNMLRSMQVLFEQKDVKLVYDVQEPVYAWANEFKMEQVLNNYISNALNHVDGEKIIKITIQRQDGHVRAGVFNTGKPIPEEDVGRIWDKFYKVDKARTREYGGSGVGLSIVKAIMESMHQQYGVINYDNGVEFWFELDDKNEA